MFNFAWSEILLIALVALIVIGPKDLPIALRGVAKLIRKMRRLAHEFQEQFDEMLRESEIKDVKKHFDDIASLPQDLAKNTPIHAHQEISTPPAHPVEVEQEKQSSRFSASVTQAGQAVSVATAEEQVYDGSRGALVAKLLKDVPAPIPPNSARFILRDQERLFPPAVIPPVFLRHGGKRVRPTHFFSPKILPPPPSYDNQGDKCEIS